MPPVRGPPLSATNDEISKILLVDAYDSFSNNVVNLLETELRNVVVNIIKIDFEATVEEIYELVSHFHAVVIGPGPGDPTKPADIGFVRYLWDLQESHVLPILGVCLGMQSLASAFGAEIKRLNEPQHGLVLKSILHAPTSIFSTSATLKVTKYHSLHAIIDEKPRSLANEENCWMPSEHCPELKPLAWESSKVNGNVLMAVGHISKPFCGVQYHPESICTNREGVKVVKEWWKAARKWNKEKGRLVSTELKNEKIRNAISLPVMSRPSLLDRARQQHLYIQQLGAHFSDLKSSKVGYTHVNFSRPIETAQIYEALGIRTTEAIILESNAPNFGAKETSSVQDPKSRYSILAVPIPGKTPLLQYFLHDTYISLGSFESRFKGFHQSTRVKRFALPLASSETPENCTEVVWQFLAYFMESQKCHDGPSNLPFWGGLIGYLSYEFGVASLGIDPHPCRVPDMNFAFIQRSIIYDHSENRVWIQSILSEDEEWLQSTKAILSTMERREPLKPIEQLNGTAAHSRNKHFTTAKSLASERITAPIEKLPFSKTKEAAIRLPNRTSYIADIETCHENIRAGESYELCLTSQSQITTRRSLLDTTNPDWALYKTLRELNPAPFAAYFSFGDITLVGCSPERFLKWTRDGKCDMRPIKGTLSKKTVSTMEEAERLLGSEKERAENLMIVDLIRHDLHGICGSGNVEVKRLMYVEEHPTVFQLVSIIEGVLPDFQGINGGKCSSSISTTSNGHVHQINETNGNRGRPSLTGIDVLAACFPPGSMTGAPKKRSCEILQSIENQPRGIYSGVLGYMCVGGSGDFSVIIRSAVRDHSLTTNEELMESSENGPTVRKCLVDRWSVGAGGAITALSDPAAEFDEMSTKSSVTLSMFTRR